MWHPGTQDGKDPRWDIDQTLSHRNLIEVYPGVFVVGDIGYEKHFLLSHPSFSSHSNQHFQELSWSAIIYIYMEDLTKLVICFNYALGT